MKKYLDKDQSRFWTERWQEGERKADEDIKAGQVKKFASVTQVIAYLKNKWILNHYSVMKHQKLRFQ